jgi:gluconokinase
LKLQLHYTEHLAFNLHYQYLPATFHHFMSQSVQSNTLPYFLGVDIGTGSTKAIAVSHDGGLLASAKQKYTINSPQPGYSEQNPDDILEAFISCIQKVSNELNHAPEAIGISSAMHSLIAVDNNGKALYPMITWADTRSEAIAQQIHQSEKAEALYRQTGTPIHPMSPLCKLIWLQQHNAELVSKTAKFISIKEYIWFRLFGRFEVDYSVASATGLFDIENRCWSAEACSLAGITAQQLSNPVDTGYSRKDMGAAIAESLGVSASVPVVIGASDGCCANLGSYVTDSTTAALTIGTSGAVRVTSPQPVYNFKAMTFNYLLNQHTYVSGGAVNNGGIAIDWLLRKFLQTAEVTDKSYQELFDAIKQVPAGSEGLLFLPYLHGERAPIWDSQSSGAFVNVKPRHSRQHFLRATLEGICYALNDVLETLESTAQLNIEQLNISGGFTNSEVWVQVLADITGKRLCINQQEDASAVGAVYLAMLAVKPHRKLPEPENAKIIQYHADNHQVYAKAFPLFRKAYQNLKEIMHELE